jgi:hypothetical protein
MTTKLIGTTMAFVCASAILLLLPAAAHAGCVLEMIDNANYGYMRAQPNLNAKPLWRLGQNVEVLWCGRTATDSRGIVWHWVATKWQEEPWIHKGWVSSRILTAEVPTIERRSAAPSFEEGGE